MRKLSLNCLSAVLGGNAIGLLLCIDIEGREKSYFIDATGILKYLDEQKMADVLSDNKSGQKPNMPDDVKTAIGPSFSAFFTALLMYPSEEQTQQKILEIQALCRESDRTAS